MPRVAGRPFRVAGYQPRHRSPRWDKADEQILAGLPPVRIGGSASIRCPDDASWLSDDCADSDFLGELTSGQIRRMLEGSAINDKLTRSIPELVYLVAHSSHTSASLARAWSAFRDATRDAHALRLGRRRWWEFFRPHDLGPSPQAEAVRIKLSLADDAWWSITNGEP
jgi:hypothetical protein